MRADRESGELKLGICNAMHTMKYFLVLHFRVDKYGIYPFRPQLFEWFAF